MQAKTALTTREWRGLVERLNASSKIKEASLRQAQLKRDAEELVGMTFRPAISEKSRELASHQKSLPERAAALMRKKKARLDRIRQERAQKELAEATFTPKINDYKGGNGGGAPPAQSAAAVQRRIGHLMQYVSHAKPAPVPRGGVCIRVNRCAQRDARFAAWSLRRLAATGRTGPLGPTSMPDQLPDDYPNRFHAPILFAEMRKHSFHRIHTV